MTAYLYQRILLAIRVFLILVFAGLLLFLVSRDLVLSGKISYSYDFLEQTPFFSQVVPLDRTVETENGLNIVDEPVYVSLFYPRPFKQVDVEIEFSNPDGLFLETGPLAGMPEYYERQALYHPQLQQLADSSAWTRSGVMLYQRNSADYRYASASQLFSQLPKQQETGYYGFDWPAAYLPAFAGSKPDATISYPLLGAHKALLAINHDDLIVNLTVSSFHHLAGDDDVVIRLLDWQGNLIAERTLFQPQKPLGVTGNKLSEEMRFTGLSFPALYRLELSASDDVVMHALTLNTPYLVFDGSLRIAGGPEYERAYGALDVSGSSFITSARSWHAQTESFDSLQTLRMAEASVTLEAPLEPVRYAPARNFRFLLDRGYEVYLQKGDVLVQGKGVFAFSQSSFFNPYPWYVDGSLDPDALGLDYVIAQYGVPEHKDGIYRQVISVDLAKAFAPEKALRLQIAAPRMIDGQSFTLHEMKARFSSDPVTLSNAYEKFTRFFKREILKN